MNWPVPQDFNEAVQNPAVAFADPDLKTGQPVVGPTGLPLPRSGNFADVYQIRNGKRDWAVKCFTRPVTGLDQRYQKVAEALAKAKLPFTIGFTFLNEGVRIRGQWMPAVKMEWVDGLQVNQVVRENVGKPAVLDALLILWSKVCRRLRDAGIAHADLQHGNVLLVPGSKPGSYGLKLIDYDGMYLPSLANQPSGELGHPNYQHPGRAATRTYSPDLDRFPHLVVATALKGLAVLGPRLWEKYDTGDNLLFTEDDFRNPAGSQLMHELWSGGNPALAALVGRLALSCGKPIPQSPWLDQIAPDGVPKLLEVPEIRDVTAALGLAQPVTAPVAMPIVAPVPVPNAFAALDLDDPEPPRKPRTKTHARLRDDADEPAKRSPLLIPLVVAGGLLLAVGAVVGGVLAFGGKKPDETAQNAPDDNEKEKPKPPDKDKPKPTDSVPPKTPDPGAPKPPDPVLPKPPDPGLPKPPDPPPPKNVDPMPATGVEVKARQTLDAPNNFGPASLHYDLDGRNVVLTRRTQSNSISYNARTGVANREWSADAVGSPYIVMPLTRGRMALQLPNDRSLHIWNPQAARSLAKVPIPELPPPNSIPIIRLSPDGRYMVAARRSVVRRDPVAGASVEPAPFRLIDTTTDKVILTFDWYSGAVQFTGDSSRVLVMDGTGRFRWFKLPSGQPNGEWTFSQKPSERGNRLHDMSTDGKLILYEGTPPGKERGMHLIDGQTGQVVHSFEKRYTASWAGMSDDGRVIGLIRNDGVGTGHTVELFDPAGKLLAWIKIPEANQNSPGHSYAMSPDGRGVAIFVPAVGKLYLFDIPVGSAVAGTPNPMPKPVLARIAVPEEAALLKAETNLRGVFKDEFARKQPAEKKALAQKLLSLADETKDDLATRYVILRDARDLAADANDPILMVQAIEGLAKWYEVDGDALKLAALEKMVMGTGNPIVLRAVVDIALAACDAASDADDFDGAGKYAQIASTAARRGSLGASAIEDAESRIAQAKKTGEAFAAIKPSMEKLKATPDDPDANLALGRYRCFVQGRWDEGLKFLAKGSNAALKAAAALDLETPRVGNADVKVADAWWDYTQSAPDTEKRSAEFRARFWYHRALGGLNGLMKARAEQRCGITVNNIEYRSGLIAEFLAPSRPTILKGVKARIDPIVDFSGGEFAGIGKERNVEFSAKWTGVVQPPRAGRYRLLANTNDPVRVKVDGKTLIDTFTSKTRKEVSVTLFDRPSSLVVEYQGSNQSQHALKLSWVAPGSAAEELVPAECLFHDRKAESVLSK